MIRCPYCEELRTEEELTFGGENTVRPAEPDRTSDREWIDYLYLSTNACGLQAEKWCCSLGCGQWFNVLWNSASHEILEVARLDP